MAAVAVRALADPTTIGRAFDLGGPRYWTYREITREVMTALGKRRAIVPMPVALIRLVAGRRSWSTSLSRSRPTSSASCGSTTSDRST